ncbi:MAG: RNA-directed DNA polymerase, partial [Candidatus Magasanikbacteria bacterium]|nr:RNA-directed DNA polymerase [Candidatus Magasanikbacteria bacterium]
MLKCDVKKFFASVNHNVLLKILKQYISDEDVLWLLNEVIGSFSNSDDRCGLPLGNLTSQLFANIYLNTLDKFIEHKLKAKYYIRYADDFILLSHDKQWLEEQVSKIRNFLQNELLLTLHPNKIFIKTVASGLDFLGWILFTNHRVL